MSEYQVSMSVASSARTHQAPTTGDSLQPAGGVYRTMSFAAVLIQYKLADYFCFMLYTGFFCHIIFAYRAYCK